MSTSKFLALSLGFLAFAAHTSWSQSTILLRLTDNTWVKQSEPDGTNGAHTRIVIGAGPPKRPLDA